MFVYISLLGLCISSLSIIVSSRRLNSSLPQKGFEYKLPDGYSIDRTVGTRKLDELQVYGAILVTMLQLAYEDSRNLTFPVLYPSPAVTLNITGADNINPLLLPISKLHPLSTMPSKQCASTTNFAASNSHAAEQCRLHRQQGDPRSAKRRLATTHRRLLRRSQHQTPVQAPATHKAKNKTTSLIAPLQRILRPRKTHPAPRLRLVRSRIPPAGFLPCARDPDRHGRRHRRQRHRHQHAKREEMGLSAQRHERAVAEPGGLSDVSRGFGLLWVCVWGVGAAGRVLGSGDGFRDDGGVDGWEGGGSAAWFEVWMRG